MVHRLKIYKLIDVLQDILNFVNVLHRRLNGPPKPGKKDDVDRGSRNQRALPKLSLNNSFTFGTRFTFAKRSNGTPQCRAPLHLLQQTLKLAVWARNEDTLLLKVFNIETILIRLIFNKVDFANLALQNFLATTETGTERNLECRVL